ncbi:MAG: N-acetylmuramoyl-L-alanine amidase [Oscillospiraceae bacterium]|nr:N-acetylmuramoyl-L-alanine amidase [Oscillospiraceae bacterium]
MKNRFFLRCVLLLICAAFALVNAAFANQQTADNFENGFIILPHAKNGEIKITRAQISLLGACNPGFPLYINGEEMPTTVSGYFSVYVELQVGDNVFVLENGEISTELVVTRETPKPFTPTPVVYFEEPLYGKAASNNISRFYDGNDDTKMGTPLAKDTNFRIIAEDSDNEMYIIHDGSYVFKSNVTLVKAGEFAAENRLYSVELQEESAEITFHNFDGTDESFSIPYEGEQPVAGYFAEFSQGELAVTLRYAPSVLENAVVLIDAGHGGSDPGALGPPGEFGLMEKDLNLQVARKTAEYLESHGVTVISLALDDETFWAVDRVEHIYESLLSGEFADLSVSIHANSMPMGSDFTRENGPLMFYTMGSSESAANIILENVSQRVSGVSPHEFKAAINRNFALARYTPSPSMLFEMGFVCNPHEYEILITDGYLDLMGEALGEGIVKYLLINAQTASENGENPSETEAAATTVSGVSESTTENSATSEMSEIFENDEIAGITAINANRSTIQVGDVAGAVSVGFITLYFIYGYIKQRKSKKAKKF